MPFDFSSQINIHKELAASCFDNYYPATMSLLRSRNTLSLGSSCLRTARLGVPANARYISQTQPRRADDDKEPKPKTSPSDAPSETSRGSSLINKESPSEAMARHQPDYNATVDHGTSSVQYRPAKTKLSLTFFQNIFPRTKASNGRK